MTLLEEDARKVHQGKARLRMAPAALYAGLPAAAQLAAFEPAPRGYRKVALMCTAILEHCRNSSSCCL